MAFAYKVLGQSAPAAATEADLYTVGAGKQTVGSTLTICNRGAAGTVRVAVRPAGAALAAAHYILYEVPVSVSDSLFLTVGLSLEATDVVTVRASSADFTFSLFGAEE